MVTDQANVGIKMGKGGRGENGMRGKGEEGKRPTWRSLIPNGSSKM